MKRLLILLLIIIILVVPQGTHAANEPLVVRTVGLIDADGSVLYSVLVASGAEALSEVTVTASVPLGAVFVEPVWQPASATFVGEHEGVVTWELGQLGPDTILGPFTFRVIFPDGNLPPANVSAAVLTSRGQADAPIKTGRLKPLDHEGTIVVGPLGTNGLVPVGDTGILINVPPGAVERETRFGLGRVPVEEVADLPMQESTWWCSVVSISTDGEVNGAIDVALVTRRTLTPAMPAQIFTKASDQTWQPAAVDLPLFATSYLTGDTGNNSAFIAPNGNYVVINDVAITSPEMELAAGVDILLREQALLNLPPGSVPPVGLGHAWLIDGPAIVED